MRFIPQNTQFNYVKMEREPNEFQTTMVNGEIYTESSFENLTGKVKGYLNYCG